MNKNKIVAIYEVDLEYPDELHDLRKIYHYVLSIFNIYYFQLYNKINFDVHYRNLEFCLKHGLILKKFIEHKHLISQPI